MLVIVTIFICWLVVGLLLGTVFGRAIALVQSGWPEPQSEREREDDCMHHTHALKSSKLRQARESEREGVEPTITAKAIAPSDLL